MQVVDVSGRKGSDLTLAVELAENSVRRQYTRQEIEDLAERLMEADYQTAPGKPKDGKRTMLTVLQAAVGRSKRQLQRILEGGESNKSEWDKATDALLRAARRVIKAGKGRDSDRAKTIVAGAMKAQTALQG